MNKLILQHSEFLHQISHCYEYDQTLAHISTSISNDMCKRAIDDPCCASAQCKPIPRKIITRLAHAVTVLSKYWSDTERIADDEIHNLFHCFDGGAAIERIIVKSFIFFILALTMGSCVTCDVVNVLIATENHSQITLFIFLLFFFFVISENFLIRICLYSKIKQKSTQKRTVDACCAHTREKWRRRNGQMKRLEIIFMNILFV